MFFFIDRKKWISMIHIKYVFITCRISLEMIMKCVCIFSKGQFTLSDHLFIGNEREREKSLLYHRLLRKQNNINRDNVN